MPTLIKPELSITSKYHISKERYYELKYFCLQYYQWVKEYKELDKNFDVGHYISYHDYDNYNLANPTAKLALKKQILAENIKVVEDAAAECDRVLGRFVFIGVTQKMPYDKLRSQYLCPCGRELYYDRYRKFFKILSDKRN